MKSLMLLSIAALIAFAACTRDPNAPSAQSVSLPTLASLPTQVVVIIVTATPQPILPPTIAPSSTLPPVSTIIPTWTPFVFPTQDTSGLGWALSTETSPFDNNVKVVIGHLADKPIQDSIGSSTPTLLIRCDSGELNVFVSVGTQIAIENGQTDQASAKVRFDQDPPQDLIMDESTSGNALFFRDTTDTLHSILTHTTMAFGFTPFEAGFTYTTFTLTGLHNIVLPLLTECHIRDTSVNP